MANETLSQHIQDCIILLSITDKDFLKAVNYSLDPKYFRSKYSKTFVRIALDFYRLHEEPVGDHFSDELSRFFKSTKLKQPERNLYVKYAEKIRNIKKPNVKYLLSRTNDFIKATEFEFGALRFVEKIEEGKFDEAHDLMLECLRAGIKTECGGTDYFDESDLETRDDDFDPDYLCGTGIEKLNNIVRGLYRGRFYILAGLYKAGKSWFAQALAKEALKSGLNILHISHELSVKELKIRYDQLFAGLTRHAEKSTLIFKWDEEEETIRKISRKKQSVLDIRKVIKVRKRLAKHGGKLIIEKFPMYSATIGDVWRLLSDLERDGFIPDLLINDYPDIMAGTDELKDLNRVVMSHKRFADELNCAVFAPSQINDVRAVRRLQVDLQHLAGLKAKSAHADDVWVLAQSKEMEDNRQILMNVLVSRNDEVSNAKFVIGHNRNIGQVCSYTIPFKGVESILNMNVDNGDDEED